jgi:hypothetical protein
MSEKQKWTTREEDLLISLDIVGADYKEMSERVGRSVSSIKGHIDTKRYQEAKTRALYGHSQGHNLVVGKVYTIHERSNSVHLEFLPAKFRYLGKNDDKVPKHVFQSVNAGTIMTFTDVQLAGYTFRSKNDKEEDVDDGSMDDFNTQS